MSDEHLSDLQLDALRLDQLEAEAVEPLRAHLATCDVCQSRRAELETNAQMFNERFDPMRLAGDTLALADQASDAPSRRGRRRFDWRVPLSLGAAVTAAAVFFVLPTERDGTRSKGKSDALEIFVLEADTPRPAPDGVVPRGSKLVLKFDPGSGKYLRFFWDSGPGSPEALYPSREAPPLRSEKSGMRFLDREIQLDESPASERLIAVFCDQPVRHSTALGVASGAGLRPDCQVHVAEVKKAER